MLSALIFAVPVSLLSVLLLRRWVRTPDGVPRTPFLGGFAVSYLAWAVLLYAWILGHGAH